MHTFRSRPNRAIGVRFAAPDRDRDSEVVRPNQTGTCAGHPRSVDAELAGDGLMLRVGLSGLVVHIPEQEQHADPSLGVGEIRIPNDIEDELRALQQIAHAITARLPLGRS